MNFLAQKLEKKHPKPYEHISKHDFTEQSDNIKNSLPSKVRVETFSKSICQLLALVKDSHTVHCDTRWYNEYIKNGGKTFPLKLRYENGKMLIDGYSANINIPLTIGDTVVSINDESMDSILTRYGKYVSAFGDTQRHYHIERHFGLYHYFEGDTKNEYVVELKNSHGKISRLTLPAVPYWQHHQNNLSSKPLFHYAFYREGKVCLFKAQSFSNNLSNKIERKINEIISEMKKYETEVFIFDLRGNGGGNAALGTIVVKRLLDKRYCQDFHPLPNSYPCKIVILCDRGTGSAASWIATYAKDLGFAAIAGEETGETASFYGNIEFIKLPHSRLSCGFSTRHFPRPAQYDDGKGVLPDIPLDVRQSDENIVNSIMIR